MPKKICSNGNRRPIQYENWNGAIAIQYDGNIILVMFDKEMEVFYKMKQLNVKTPERKLQLVWDKSYNLLVIFFNFQVLSGFQ